MYSNCSLTDEFVLILLCQFAFLLLCCFAEIVLPWKQEKPLHNRWHPNIPPVATVEEGEVFRVECIDWTGGQIKNNDCSDDVKNVDLTQCHYLSGPIEIPTAQPGDLL